MHRKIASRILIRLGLTCLACLTATSSAFGVTEDELLAPDQAFSIAGRADQPESVKVEWRIADGYYLYKNKFKFESETAGIDLGPAELPIGEIKKDEFFGNVEIYRGSATIQIPLKRTRGAEDVLTLKATSQGCADIGVCYPPHRQTILVKLSQPTPPAAAAASPTASLSALTKLGAEIGLAGDDDILSPEQAFRFDATVEDSTHILARWEIADAHYLYRDKIKLSLANHDGIQLGSYELPQGEEKEDEFFGRIQVYHDSVEVLLPVSRSTPEPVEVMLLAEYQGCAERGICYPPSKKSLPLTLPAHEGGLPSSLPAGPSVQAAAPPAIEAGGPEMPEQDRVTRMLAGGNTLLIIGFMFLAGLLLAFTACVYPMIPILSSIIVGQGREITAGRGFLLSLIYVEAVAVTYAIIGILSGKLGAGVQAYLQNPWVLGFFALVFVALALSMFGFYSLQIPNALQGKLSELSNRQQGGTFIGVAAMGMLSALIVGPCAGPVLFGAMAYVSQSGDYVLGGLSFFALGNGMGAPLLLIGASGGKLLPKAGGWMDTVKHVFGVVLLALAITMIERFLLGSLTLMLWSLLFVVSGIYLGALEPVEVEAAGWKRLWKGLGVASLVYGVIVMLGVASGGRDVLRPLAGLSLAAAETTEQGTRQQHLAFKRIKSVADLERELKVASQQGRFTMLDFYADWCTYCIKMENYVFPDPSVQAKLSDVVLLQADVTANDETDRELLNRFGLFTPPAILFFGPEGAERRQSRLIGDTNAPGFLALLERTLI